MTETGETKPPRRRRQAVRHGLRAIWLLASAPLVFAVIAAVSLIDREITAPSWVAQRIEARAAASLNGGAVDFGRIALTIGRDLHPRARAFDVVLRDADGQVLARVDELGGQLSPRGLLFERAALVQEIRLRGVAVDLRRDANGRVALSFGQGTAQAGAAPGLVGLLDLVDQTFARPELAAFEQVAVDGVEIAYTDDRAGRTWRAADGQVQLDVRQGQTRLSLGFAVVSDGQAGRVALDYASPDDSRAAEVMVRLDNIASRDLASQLPALAWLAALDAPLGADLTTRLDDTAAVQSLTGQLRIGAGQLAAGGGVGFDGADVTLAYDPAAQQAQFDQIAVRGEWGAVTLTGETFAPAAEGGLPNVLVGQFRGADLRLNPAGLYPAPVGFGDLHADLRLQLDPFRIDLGQAVLRAPDGVLVARGQAAPTDAGWRASLDLRGDRMDRARLLTLWPETFRPGTRKWFATHIETLQMTDLQLGWRLTPERGARMVLQYDFDDMTLRPFQRVPPVEAGAGSVSLIDNRFVMRLDRGHVSAPEGGRVEMAGSTMEIPDTTEDGGPMTLVLEAAGTITAQASLMNQPPFLLMDRVRQPVTLAEGRARTTARLTFPRVNPVPIAQLGYDVSARLSDVTTTTLIPDRALSSRALVMQADNAQISFAGPVRLDDVPLRGTWTQVMGQAGSQVTAELPLSPATLAAFDIALPRDAVAGQTQAALTIDLRAGAAPRYRLTSDLQGAEIRIPQIGWRKAPRAAGRLELTGQLGAQPSVDDLLLQGPGLSAEGRIALAPGGGLEAARFARVQIGDWFDAPVTLRGRGAGRPVGVAVSGGLLNLPRAQFGAGDGGAGGPLTVALDRLQVTDQIALRGFRGEFSSTGGLSGQFTATVNGGPGLRGTVAPQNGRTAVRLQADDAGAVVAAAGFLKNGVGGALDLRLIPTGAAGSFDGYLDIDRIRVRDAPAMAALLDAISVVGLLQQLDGQGLSFDEVDARFRLTPGRITVTEASAIGPGLGISLDGIYSTEGGVFDLQGVVSPFYLLNGIGSVLTRRGEGLIGFNFTLRGTAAAPQVAVNPLSALTPGMFRDIFRRPPPEVTQ